MGFIFHYFLNVPSVFVFSSAWVIFYFFFPPCHRVVLVMMKGTRCKRRAREREKKVWEGTSYDFFFFKILT